MRQLVMGAVAAATACAVFSPTPARAWHQHGHMAVALIAYRELDEAGQKKVLDVLKDHPHFKLFLSADAPADARPDEWVVMRAAIWPDWVKSPFTAPADRREAITDEFGHGNWHYVNMPIRMLEGAGDQARNEIEANINNEKKDRGQVLKVLPRLLAGLKTPGSVDFRKMVSGLDEPTVNEAEARAVALCWVFHLVGDLHQPLHAATAFSAYSRDGDKGGNNFYVRWGNGFQNLHMVWDGAFGWDEIVGLDGSMYAAVDGLARDILGKVKAAAPITPQERGETSPDAWAAESHKLAKEKAYYVNDKRVPGYFTTSEEHLPDPSYVHPLPPGYVTLARKVAERRVNLAGYRLAEVLKATL